jgi:DNA-directed RNA polymerase sigma subunit (sigma70/sigma32)
MDNDPLFSDDPVRVYVATLREDHRPLSREEELACVQQFRAGDWQAERAKKRLLEGNLLLVVSIAERYGKDRIHVLDLIQEENTALLRALQSFRDSSEDSFSVHATPFIERAIMEAISASDSSGA